MHNTGVHTCVRGPGRNQTHPQGLTAYLSPRKGSPLGLCGWVRDIPHPSSDNPLTSLLGRHLNPRGKWHRSLRTENGRVCHTFKFRASSSFSTRVVFPTGETQSHAQPRSQPLEPVLLCLLWPSLWLNFSPCQSRARPPLLISCFVLTLSHFSRIRLSATPWTMARQAPLSIGFSRQEYWSGLSFPSPVIKYEVNEVNSLKSCLTLCDPMDCSLTGSSVHGIFQARVLEWVPLPSPISCLVHIK